MQNGGALVLLQAVNDQQAQQAADILDGYHPVDITDQRSMNTTTTTKNRSSSTQGSTGRGRMSSQYAGNEMVVPIVKEEIHVGKRQVDRGGVRVETNLVETLLNI